MSTLVFNLPPNELRANQRGGQHWAAVLKAKRAYKQHCDQIIRAHHWTEDTGSYPVGVTVVAYITPRMKVDPSDLGYWCKTNLDCLVQAGVFKDDSHRHIRPFTCWAEVGTPQRIEISW